MVKIKIVEPDGFDFSSIFRDKYIRLFAIINITLVWIHFCYLQMVEFEDIRIENILN